MSHKLAQLMGKNTEAIIKYTPVNIKEYSQKLEEKLKRQSEKKKESEKKRKAKMIKTLAHISNCRPIKKGTSMIPITGECEGETKTYEYVVPSSYYPDIYKDSDNEQREKKEKLDNLKLNRQFFNINYRPFHMFYITPYKKEPFEISCLNKFSEDKSNVELLEQDYLECYEHPLTSIKNLGRYDCWEDETPEQLMERCRKITEESKGEREHGKSPMYDSKKEEYIWNNAFVLDYYPETQKYKIKFSFTTKEVPRLSLYFMWEDYDEFRYRKFLCSERRENVDQFLLFTRYVDNVPDNIVTPLSFDWQCKIANKVKFKTKNLSEKYNLLFDESNPVFKRQLDIIAQDYLRQMKKCRILIEMQEPRNFKEFKNRSLKIRPFFRNIPTEKRGIENRSADLERRMQDLKESQDLNIFAKDSSKKEQKVAPIIYNKIFVTKMLNAIMEKANKMVHVKLIISNLNDLKLPMDISVFEEHLKKYNNSINDEMKKLSSKQFADVLRSCNEDEDKPDQKNGTMNLSFMSNSEAVYKKSIGKRIVLFFNLYLKDKIKELIDNSIVSFMNTFKGFGKCRYSLTGRKELYAQIGSHYLEEKVPLFSSKITIQEEKPKDEKQKKGKAPKIEYVFEPRLKSYENMLIDSFKNIKKLIKTNFKTLDKFCFRMLNSLTESELYFLDDKYCLYEQALAELVDMIEDSKKAAREVKEEYKPFQELMAFNEKTYIENKLGKSDSKILDVEKCSEILKNLRQLETLLKDKGSLTNVRLFSISTVDLKEKINEKISKAIKVMLNKMVDHCKKITDDILKEKKEKVEKLREEIVGFEKYDEIQKLIVTIESFIGERETQLTNVDEILNQIEAQKHLDMKPAQLYMNLVEGWTIRDELLSASKKASENLNLKKGSLIKEVADLRAEFKKTLGQLSATFEIVNKVDDFNMKIDGQDVSMKVSKCKDNINDLEVKKRDIQLKSSILNFSEEQNPEEEGQEEESPDFEKFKDIKDEFKPFGDLWDENIITMSDYQSKVTEKKLSELKDPVTGKNNMASPKEVFSYITGLVDSAKKVDDIYKKYMYDSTIVKLCDILKNKIADFKSYNWMIENLNSAFLKDNDWNLIREITHDSSIDKDCKLIDLRKKDIDKYRQEIELIKTKAYRRQTFNVKYKAISAEFNNIHVEPKDSNKTSLKNIDEHLAKLDELGGDLSTIISNPVTQSDNTLKRDTQILNEKIKNSQTIFEEISKLQANYLYLAPIFSANEINKALIAEKADFDKVNKFWLNIMFNLDQSAWEFATFLDKENYSNLYTNLIKNTTELQNIIIRLNQYLNTKRAEFPRFYFVSDEDLLRILAQSKNPLLIQPHLSKCFEGIHHVEFNADNTVILKMVSSSDEVIPLLKEINVNSDECRGNVEVWLGKLEEDMIETMKDLSKQCFDDISKKKRIDWIKEMHWPGQITQVIDQIRWTVGVEEALFDNKLTDYCGKLKEELSEVVDLVRNTTNKILAKTLSCIIIVSVHDRDIVEQLIESKVEKVTDFDWKAQMRYYFHKEEEEEEGNKKKKKKNVNVCPVSVAMVTTNLNYGFEYLGNVSRLVITPLTDRCFRTLFGAYNVQYGGAPEGPAGTGKTESVKDLAKCVGVMCNVFNCTEGIKIQGMSKFFKGLASSGCWCCFDEFNRIDTEVLSVIAQQILTIQTALKAHQPYFYFEETEQIKLRDTCAINITMNPSYSGRNELPDNLKALFRPCAMMVADYSLIAEIKLYSFGFQNAKSLSFKIVSSLKLSSEQLSTQSHYDFGMRALNAIIVAAGNEKKKNIDLAEDRIVLKALIDVNLAKFTTNDTDLFKDLVHDLFPSTKPLESDLASLEEEIKNVCLNPKNQLQPTDNFIKKCIQLWQTMNVRHALMVVGKPGMAKSKVISTLKEAVSNLPKEQGYNKVESIVLNPKSIFQKNLYGYFDISQEWKKGLLQVKMTDLCEKEKEIFKWLIFDGPVDTLWIENMNSLLDDNKKLCLEDSSAIYLANNMNIVFEVDDLREASPATVSRNGMVLCEQDTISTDDLIKSYALKLPDDKNFENPKIKAQFTENSIWITNTVLEYINRQKIEFGLPCDKFHLVSNFLKIFDCYLKDYRDDDFLLTKEKLITAEKMDNLIISSVIMGIFGPIKKDRTIQDFLFDMCLGNDVNKTYNLNFNNELSSNKYQWQQRTLTTNIHQSIENIFENVFLIQTGKWHKLLEMPGKEIFKLKEELKFNELIIPTIETIKMEWLINTAVPNKKHLLFTGNTGTGKTLTVVNTLSKNYETDYYTYIKMSMTAQTTAHFTQELIEKKLQKSYRKFAPPSGKNGVIFVDDLNMPQKEKFGAQPPIELLRQWMDYGGWYDLVSDTKDFVNINNVSFLASMGSIASGRTISDRYKRHYIVHFAENYAKETMDTIYNNIIQWFFLKTKNPNFSPGVIGMKDDLIKSTIQMYHEVASTFKATPAKTHYQFNLRDISRVFLGISRANARTVLEETDMLGLWIHECERVFKDRLVNQEDREIYQQILKRVLKNSMRRDNEFEGKDLLWGDFVNMIYIDNDPKKGCIEGQYCELKDSKLLKETLDKKLELYNVEIGSKSEGGGPLNLVLFDYAIQHLTRILRIISTYNGNAVLVGVGGSGRKSLTKLATFMYNFVLKQSEGDWRDYLKTMFIELGSKELVFLVSDAQVNDKQIEDINNMLNNGEVPNLIESQELQTIKETIPQEFIPENKKLQTDQDISNAFIENCKARIHVVLTMSPIGDSFRKRILMFPSLVSCTTIDWFLSWPKEALSSVANYYLSSESEIDKSLLNNIIKICVDMQDTVIKASDKFYLELKRKNYVTPMSFIELLNLFKNLLEKRKGEIQHEILRYKNGLEVLKESDEKAKEMGEEIKELEPKLKEQTKKTEQQLEDLKELAKQLEIDEAKGKEEKEKATEVEKIAKEQNDNASKIASEMEEKKESTKNLLSKVKVAEVLEIQKSKPDKHVERFCFYGCLLMLKNPKPKGKPGPNPKDPLVYNYYEHYKTNIFSKYMGQKFLTFIQKASFPDVTRKQMEEFRDTLKNDTEFHPEKKGETLANLFDAFKCLNTLFFLNEDYKPLKEQADKAKQKLEEAQETVRKIEEKLAQTLETQKQKKQEVDDANALIKKLNDKKEQCTKRLRNAGILKNSLGNEKEEWTKKKQNLEEFSVNIVGDILMSAGIIAYLGAFTKTYREDIVLNWAKKIKNAGLPISYSETKNPNDIMRSIIGDPMEIEEWKSHYLPNDNFSADNALIMSKSRRFCLLIDPQNQALIWLKEKIKLEEKSKTDKKHRHGGEENKKTERRKDGATTPHYTIKPIMDAKLMTDIALDCVQNGHQLIFENAGEELPQCIAPIYKKEFITSGNITQLSLNNNTYEVSPNFRLFILTQLPKPHYLPDICVALTIVNFTVTEEGLQDQMLNFLVEKDEPALNESRRKCINTTNENNRTIKVIETDILRLLQESKEKATEDNTILDNNQLIEKLNKSNETTKKIEQNALLQKDTEVRINTRRTFLSPVSVHVAQLFFTVCDLSSIEPVYQYSLKFYQDIFGRAIDLTPKDPNEKDESPRLDKMKITFNSLLYDKICMSLFEKDKLVFSFLMQSKIKSIPFTLEEKEAFNKEIRMFVTGGSGKETDKPNPAKDDPSGWISQVQWNSLCELSQSLKTFKMLDDEIISHLEDWKKAIALSNDPFFETFPEPFNELSDFYKLIILRILRPDKVVPALKKYISDNIGEKYCISPSFDIEKAYDESRNKTPILFIISPGADPLVLIDKLCRKKDRALDTDVKTLSLGQGQEKIAEDAIDKAQKDPEKWIVLQNCHLAKSFMNRLEKKIDEIVDNANSTFRLFLTALPSNVLPITVIQDSIKIVNEPPRGLKQSLERAFGTLDEYTYEKAIKGKLYRRFAYGFAFFHALILERRKYNALGWNIPYEFSNSDLSISLLQLKNFLEDYEDIQYSALNYMVAEANYGGRVTDPADRRLIAILFKDICCEAILDDNYTFSNQSEYKVPPDGSFKEHEDFIINTVPQNSSPGIFGLHDNADITCAIAETNSLLSTTLLTLPRNAGSSLEKSPEELVKDTVIDYLNKLPNFFDVDNVRTLHPNKHEESLNSVLHQELMRYNNLLGIVKSSLKNIKDAIDGNAVMTNEIEGMLQSVYDNKTPDRISKVSYPSMMPFSSWVKDFIKKLEFFEKWIKEGIPPTFWISAFYFTHSFLTGILQNYARKHEIPIDELCFDFEVMSNIEEYNISQKPEDGCYIYGFYIEGARWNSEIKLLDESLPKDLLPSMPHVWFKPAKKGSKDHKSKYECPVYRTSRRSGELLTTGQSTNFLIHIYLPFDNSKYTSEHWVKRGTAILCSLNE